ncbi:MAG: DUF1634 domain-containing protein [Dehalococcoidia bacterium]|nr:DUF1634 domain-containing protein [Dehalococcoidia bacterium]
MKNIKMHEGRLKNWASLIFLVGIAISLTLIVIGFIILIYISGFKDIQPLVRLEQIPAAIVISIGILILLLVPIIQVILSIIFFSMNRNRLFIGISVAVLCLAAISLVLALT